MGVVAECAETVSVMYLGKVVESGDVQSIFKNPSHPYTKKLINAIPKITRERKDFLEEITGSVPDATAIPSGCPFHPRCHEVIEDKCEQDVPKITRLSASHYAACHLLDGRQSE